jgi:hypothetical protein
MADYAIGLSFHKAHRTLVRAVELTAPNRYFANRDAAGAITLPTLDTGASYLQLGGLTKANFQVNDKNQDFRLLGDDGWSDSVITGASVQASVSAYFARDTEIPAGTTVPVFRGNYDEGFNVIQRSRYDKTFEVYFEFLKELGQANGTTGNFIYDFTGFNACISNYQESMSAEGLTEISFDLMSRGRPVFGRYDAGSTALSIGAIQSTVLFTAPSSGIRRYATVPLDNAQAVVTTGNLTVTYTSDGTVALTQLGLGQTDGSGFRLEVASTGVAVPCAVSLATNVVTIDPLPTLAAGTIYRLKVADGAITQAVDANGTASASGFRRPMAGFTTEFRTA